ncbi:MAG: DUF2970 domain-containing protein [Colwellia sp.]
MIKLRNNSKLTAINAEEKNKQSLFSTLKSVSAAFVGVQSDKNRQDDFNQGKISHFIIAGIICTGIFIAGLVTVVSLVIPSS